MPSMCVRFLWCLFLPDVYLIVVGTWLLLQVVVHYYRVGSWLYNSIVLLCIVVPERCYKTTIVPLRCRYPPYQHPRPTGRISGPVTTPRRRNKSLKTSIFTSIRINLCHAPF